MSRPLETIMPRGNPKLDTAAVLLAMNMRSQGYTLRKIAAVLDVTELTLHNALSGRTAYYVRDDLLAEMERANPGRENAIVERRTRGGDASIELQYADGYNAHDGITLDITVPSTD